MNMNCCGLNAERRGNLHVTEGMDYRDAWGWIGIGSSGRRHEGFHSIISIDNCEGCVKRCLAVNPSKPLSRAPIHSTPLFSPKYPFP